MIVVSKLDYQIIVEGEKAARKGIFTLLSLGILKLAAGLTTGIGVIIADAISTFADTLGVFASYIGLKLSKKTADTSFAYGYYKFETLSAFLISLGIVYMGYKTISTSIINFNHLEKGDNHLIALSVTIVAILVSYYLSSMLLRAGEKANSLALKASAQDKKMDVVSSFVILLSIFANYKGIPYIESVVSIIIGLFILKVGVTSAKDSLFFLLDYWNDPLLTRKIKKILLAENDLIQQVKKIRLRRAGTFIFGEAFVEINPFSDIQDLRSELAILQSKIENLSPYLRDFPIYSHVPEAKKFKIAIPIKKGRTIKAEVAQNLAETNFYMFVAIQNKAVKSFYLKPLAGNEKKVIQLANFIRKEKVNILLDNKLNSLVYYNLRRSHQVMIFPLFSGVKTANEAVKFILIDS